MLVFLLFLAGSFPIVVLPAAAAAAAAAAAGCCWLLPIDVKSHITLTLLLCTGS